MPYIAFRDETEIHGFAGLALTIGWIAEEKDFQIALTIGSWTVAVGLDFGYWG